MDAPEPDVSPWTAAVPGISRACAGACVDPRRARATAAPAATFAGRPPCVSGAFRPSCAPVQTWCGAAVGCVNTQSEPQHCGGWEPVPCGPVSVNNGRCATSCTGARTVCTAGVARCCVDPRPTPPTAGCAAARAPAFLARRACGLTCPAGGRCDGALRRHRHRLSTAARAEPPAPKGRRCAAGVCIAQCLPGKVACGDGLRRHRQRPRPLRRLRPRLRRGAAAARVCAATRPAGQTALRRELRRPPGDVANRGACGLACFAGQRLHRGPLRDAVPRGTVRVRRPLRRPRLRPRPLRRLRPALRRHRSLRRWIAAPRRARRTDALRGRLRRPRHGFFQLRRLRDGVRRRPGLRGRDVRPSCPAGAPTAAAAASTPSATTPTAACGGRVRRGQRSASRARAGRLRGGRDQLRRPLRQRPGRRRQLRRVRVACATGWCARAAVAPRATPPGPPPPPTARATPATATVYRCPPGGPVGSLWGRACTPTTPPSALRTALHAGRITSRPAEPSPSKCARVGPPAEQRAPRASPSSAGEPGSLRDRRAPVRPRARDLRRGVRRPTSDTATCGACGTACVAGQSCVAGACRLVCPAGGRRADRAAPTSPRTSPTAAPAATPARAGRAASAACAW